jgi:mono/diheme cytochrome c family protein
VPVALPAYSVAYADNTQGELQRLRAEIELQKLRNDFEMLKLQLQQPEKLQAPPKKLAVEEHPGVGILRKNCASCHNSDKAFQKGNGFVLFDGDKLAEKFTDRDKLNIAREVFSNRMPKGTKGLADADVGLVMAWLDTLK